ncbi:Oidioi.mRNA.OKI2018_I69.chr2.g4175.t1.cds [Oikopleura dioica]|uniref:Oidioi.mRNA.OKI2018_I69.chr2.g4175.t1.cds n=1 Tax=Oikopleura dioica TaxID=34765 RepID=A0ABN7T1Y7_OIKDI|nr:Oidioi.mRNA.OKI2018_I69.chr2.g4175.t1.cds [Oikopleura dioica]
MLFTKSYGYEKKKKTKILEWANLASYYGLFMNLTDNIIPKQLPVVDAINETIIQELYDTDENCVLLENPWGSISPVKIVNFLSGNNKDMGSQKISFTLRFIKEPEKIIHTKKSSK